MAKKDKKDVYKASREWMLPTPCGAHFASQFLFTTDDPTEQSARIRSHRLGSLELGGETGGSFADPTKTVPIGANGKGTISGRYLAAVDPTLTAEAITGSRLLRSVVEDALSDSPLITIENGARVYALEYWRKLGSELYGIYHPPPIDWELSVTPSQFEADEGSETSVELTIHAPSAGDVLVAFYLTDLEQPLKGFLTDGLQDGLISDIVQVSANENGEVFAKIAHDFGPGSI